MTSAINPGFSVTFPCAYPSLNYSADFRRHPEDFRVDEILGFSFSGEGEHACFFLQKTSQNTHWVASQMAQHDHMNDNDIGFCGRKDRHAITRQWFSIYDPHRRISADNFPVIEGVTVLQSTRHCKKLRPGNHAANNFAIVLSNVYDSQEACLTENDKTHFLDRAVSILQQGVPNYFGPQRFGRDANNLQLAQAWFVDGVAPQRRQKSMVLSAARSWIFNQVLAERIRQQCWRQPLAGDVINEDGVSTGPLWGRGRLPSSEAAHTIEVSVQQQFPIWCERLEYQGLQQERRPLMLSPEQIDCGWQGNNFLLRFVLPCGAFATAVLAELVELRAP